MKKILNLGLIIMLVLTITGCSLDENKENTNENKKVENKDTKKEENNTYKLNDTIVLNNGDGTMNLKFLSVNETKKRNEFEDKQYKKIIFIEYYYENIDLDEDFYIDENNFKVYDKNNTILETYPLGDIFATAISKGRNATHKIAYGLNSDDNYIEIELRSQSTGKSLNKKVILEW